MLELDLRDVPTGRLDFLDRIASLAAAKYRDDDEFVSASFAAIVAAIRATGDRRNARIVGDERERVALPLDGDADPAELAAGLHRLAGVLYAIHAGADAPLVRTVFGNLSADVANLSDARRLEARRLQDQLDPVIPATIE